MFKEFGYEVGRWDLARFRERAPQGSFTVLDLEWTLLPDVWPGNAVATRLFTSWLPYREGGSRPTLHGVLLSPCGRDASHTLVWVKRHPGDHDL